jgi:hypothetical protein
VCSTGLALSVELVTTEPPPSTLQLPSVAIAAVVAAIAALAAAAGPLYAKSLGSQLQAYEAR